MKRGEVWRKKRGEWVQCGVAQAIIHASNNIFNARCAETQLHAKKGLNEKKIQAKECNYWPYLYTQIYCYPQFQFH